MSAGLQRPVRYELVFEDSSSARGSRPSLLASLKALGQIGGASVGNAYAVLATTVLHGIERLEDLSAERRLKQRSHGRAESAASPRLASRQTKSLLPAK